MKAPNQLLMDLVGLFWQLLVSKVKNEPSVRVIVTKVICTWLTMTIHSWHHNSIEDKLFTRPSRELFRWTSQYWSLTQNVNMYCRIFAYEFNLLETGLNYLTVFINLNRTNIGATLPPWHLKNMNEVMLKILSVLCLWSEFAKWWSIKLWLCNHVKCINKGNKSAYF